MVVLFMFGCIGAVSGLVICEAVALQLLDHGRAGVAAGREQLVRHAGSLLVPVGAAVVRRIVASALE